MAKAAKAVDSVKTSVTNYAPSADGVKASPVKEGDVRNQIYSGKQKPRAPGNWRKASPEEVAKLEAEGRLKGYDRKAGEVLVAGEE